MGKPKKFTNNDEDFKLSSKKMITADGKVKKKIAKQFTPYKCEFCTKKFHDKYGLRVHEQIHYNEEYPCELCSHVAKTKRYLANHVKHVHKARRHKCDLCDMAFVVPNELRDHMMVHTGEKPHKCEVCGKSFRATYTLNCHMRIHTNEKPFKCSFCEYACRDGSTLRKHELRHMGYVKTFDCKLCTRKFPSKSRLKYHISSVHLNYLELDLKKHRCEHCGKTFHRKGQLTQHIQYSHDPSQAVPCPICGKTMKHKRYLVLHLRTHFAERPHACGYAGCGRRFKCKGDLKKHSIIHTPELHRPCPKCDMRFSRPERLARHMKTHEPRSKSVFCDYCGVAFYTKNYLIKHITQKHCKEKEKYICDYCGLVTYNKPSIVMHLSYGQCRDEELYCKICKVSCKYKNKNTLRSHYLMTHKIRYKPRKQKKKVKQHKATKAKETKPSIEIKVEAVDDPYEDTQFTAVKDEIDIEKHEIDEEDLAYSNNVLSEDLQEYLLKDEGELPESGTFDAFLMQHLFEKPVKKEKEDKVETDEHQETIVTLKIRSLLEKAQEEKARKKLEKKKKKEAKLLEKKLKKEAKLLRAKRRREKFELERVREMYNERMRRAAEEATNKKKEPTKKITYFKNKVTEETESNQEKEADKNHDNTDKEDSNAATNHHKVDKNIQGNSDPENIKIGDDNANIELATDHENNNLSNIALHDKTNDIDTENDSIRDKHELTNDHCTEKNNAQSNKKITTDENKNDSQDCSNNDVNNTEISEKDNEIQSSNPVENCSKENFTEIAPDDQKNNNDEIEDLPLHGLRNKRKRQTNDEENYSNDDIIDDDKTSCSDSDFNPDSGDEAVPRKKMNFKSFQCYICFKLFPTREDQLNHCSTHFDVCSTKTLSKCPICGHVTSKNLEAHMKKNHDIDVLLPHNKITKKEDRKGSKYCLELKDTVVEIIPSVKTLNHQASKALDKKKREIKDMTVAKTKLVKKGKEWILEKVKVDASIYKELPEFTDEELSKLPASSNYTERLGQLGRLARSKKLPMLYPCNRCDKICQNFAALRLHERRHDPDKKPFAPKKYKRDCKTPPPKETPKVTNIEHRFSKPQPIKNNHQCDEKLMKFYETHIRGDDIEFWQFLKIYNKMDRENINDFKDLEGRIEFGIHTPDMLVGNEPKLDENISKVGKSNTNDDDKPNTSDNYKNTSKIAQNKYSSNTKNNINAISSSNFRQVTSKLAQKSGQIKNTYKRVILLSRKERMERERIKIMMRERINGNK